MDALWQAAHFCTAKKEIEKQNKLNATAGLAKCNRRDNKAAECSRELCHCGAVELRRPQTATLLLMRTGLLSTSCNTLRLYERPSALVHTNRGKLFTEILISSSPLFLMYGNTREEELLLLCGRSSALRYVESDLVLD